MPRSFLASWARAIALCICALPATAGAAPGAGSGELVTAMERSTCTVLGRIEDRAQLDPHGYAAWLAVEGVLAGDCGSGPRVRLGWEELARARPPRFRDGDRIVVALEPIPGQSLWRTRFADDLQRGPVLTPAAGGNAWLKDPDPDTVTRLAAWAATAGAEPGERLIALAQMARVAPEPLGAGAVARLAQLAAGDSALPDAAIDALAAVIADTAAPRGLRLQIVAAAGQGKWSGLRPALAAATAAGSGIVAAAFAALAEMDGGLPQDRVALLLQDSDPAVRTVGVTWAIDPKLLDTLPALMTGDPDAGVRAAAAAALVRRRGIVAIGTVRPAFADPAPEVPVALAEAIAGLGESAVAPLEDIFEHGSFAEARGAALALHGLGAPGRECLARLAHEASDEQRRHLAEIAVGRLETHTH